MGLVCLELLIGGSLGSLFEHWSHKTHADNTASPSIMALPSAINNKQAKVSMCAQRFFCRTNDRAETNLTHSLTHFLYRFILYSGSWGPTRRLTIKIRSIQISHQATRQWACRCIWCIETTRRVCEDGAWQWGDTRNQEVWLIIMPEHIKLAREGGLFSGLNSSHDMCNQCKRTMRIKFKRSPGESFSW